MNIRLVPGTVPGSRSWVLLQFARPGSLAEFPEACQIRATTNGLRCRRWLLLRAGPDCVVGDPVVMGADTIPPVEELLAKAAAAMDSFGPTASDPPGADRSTWGIAAALPAPDGPLALRLASRLTILSAILMLNNWMHLSDANGLDRTGELTAPDFADGVVLAVLRGLQPTSLWLLSPAFLEALGAWKFRRSAEFIVRGWTDWLRRVAGPQDADGTCPPGNGRCPIVQREGWFEDLPAALKFASRADEPADVRVWQTVIHRRDRLDAIVLTPDAVTALNAWCRVSLDPIVARPDSVLANGSLTTELLRALDLAHPRDRVVLQGVAAILAGRSTELQVSGEEAGWGVRGLLASPLLSPQQRGQVLLDLTRGDVAVGNANASPRGDLRKAEVAVASEVLPRLLRRAKRMVALGRWLIGNGISLVFESTTVSDEVQGMVVNNRLGAATEPETQAWDFWLRAIRGKPPVGTRAGGGG